MLQNFCRNIEVVANSRNSNGLAKSIAAKTMTTVGYCTVLYCTVLYCTVLYYTVLQVLYCSTILYCAVLQVGRGTPFINVSFSGLLWGYKDELPCHSLAR